MTCLYITSRSNSTLIVICPATLILFLLVANSFWTHGLQNARISCPLLSPRVCSNVYSLSQWCHPTISSSVTHFSSHLQSFPSSGSFSVSQLLALGGQSIGDSSSVSVLPRNIQGWFPLGFHLVGSPCSPRDSQESSLASKAFHISKASILWCLAFFMVQVSHALQDNQTDSDFCTWHLFSSFHFLLIFWPTWMPSHFLLFLVFLYFCVSSQYLTSSIP